MKTFTVDGKTVASHSISSITKGKHNIAIVLNKLLCSFKTYNNFGLSEPLPNL